jgi:hypothetical protein
VRVLYGVRQLDVRPAAPLPYIARAKEDGTHQFVWAPADAPWVLTVIAPGEADLASLTQALAAILGAVQGGNEAA